MTALFLLLSVAQPIWVGRFTGAGAPPAPWQVVQISTKVPPTRYRRAAILGVPAIEARSVRSMALLARPISLDLAATPVLCWRWLIDAPVARADMTKKSGDDYAARLYVSFDVPDAQMTAGTRLKLRLARSMFGRNVPDAALNYVWDNRHPVGTVRKSPFTDRAQLIVAETGSGRAKQWVSERANIAADFARLFGGTARPIQIAVASDTDNTGGSARAAFADLHFVGSSESCRS